MQIQVFPCNPFQENTYIVYDEISKDAVVIDAGFYNAEEFHRADEFVQKNSLHILRVLSTHLHLDHCIGNGFALRGWNVSDFASKKDLFLIEQASSQAKMFGLELSETLPSPQGFLSEGDEIVVGNFTLKVIEVPGHSAGGLAFYAEKENVLFAGDTLFRNSYGRTDLPGGNFDTLMQSLKKLFTLPAETFVLCGHGPATKIGIEKENFGKF